MRRTIILLLTFAGGMTRAEISDTLRRSDAVVLYDFTDTDPAVVRDKANSKWGAPVDLTVKNTGLAFTKRGAGYIELTEKNLITNALPATKVNDTCKANKEMTIEVWLENNESAKDRSVMDIDRHSSPLRILTLASSNLRRNFVFGQYYDTQNRYVVGVNTAQNENNPSQTADNAPNRGNSLRDPLMSGDNQLIFQNTTDPAPFLQKIVFTVNNAGVAKLFLTDKSGSNYYPAMTVTTNFGGGFGSWRSDARISIGNEAMTNAQADTFFNRPTPTIYNTSHEDGDEAAIKALEPFFSNPNRYWKGKLYMVAIYCRALTSQEILGAGAPKNPNQEVVAIDLNDVITPERQKAQEIFSRLTGVKAPIDHPTLKDMEAKLKQNDPMGAAGLALSHPNFYNITMRDFAARMSNREETIVTPLNDFITTMVGFVRDDVGADKWLTENAYYVGDPAKTAVPLDVVQDLLKSNNHFDALTKGNYSLANVLVRKEQILYNGTKDVPNTGAAGLLTTRAWMAAHAVAGTNRRPVEYTFREFLCTPIEKWADATGPDNYIGRDIDRFPAGSHAKFTTTCRACHSAMDPLRGAFARYTFSNNFVKNALVVPNLGKVLAAVEDASNGISTDPAFISSKMNQNETVFPGGRIIKDEYFENLANRGSNVAHFGWNGPMKGYGLTEFGRMIASSDAYPRCLARRVYFSACKREPASFDETMINNVAKEFVSHGYNIKYLFERIVTTPECLGGKK